MKLLHESTDHCMVPHHLCVNATFFQLLNVRCSPPNLLFADSKSSMYFQSTHQLYMMVMMMNDTQLSRECFFFYLAFLGVQPQCELAVSFRETTSLRWCHVVIWEPTSHTSMCIHVQTFIFILGVILFPPLSPFDFLHPFPPCTCQHTLDIRATCTQMWWFFFFLFFM